MLDPYFGLGADASADSLIVEWPSGSINVLLDVPAGLVTVVENDPASGVAAAAVVRAELRLVAAPNPSRGGGVTLVAHGRRAGQPARLRLVDAAGRRVLDRSLAPGADRVAWDGRDERGRAAAAGIYFARLTEGDRSTDARVVHLGR
jgi:hypothetical protein